jgi:hypothetical protein
MSIDTHLSTTQSQEGKTKVEVGNVLFASEDEEVRAEREGDKV